MQSIIKKKILVIDDDEEIRQALSIKLKKQDYIVLEAVDGHAGLERLKLESPDMVMVDVQMPVMGGFEFCEHAAKLDSKKHIPIIIMTAQDDQASVNKAYDKGATDFITKPINYAKLEHRVRFSLRASEMAEQLANRERQLLSAQSIAKMGEWVYDVEKQQFHCSDEVANIFAVDKKKISSYDDLMKYVIDSDANNLESVLNNVSAEQQHYSVEYAIEAGDGKKKRIRQIIDINVDDPMMEGKLFGIFQDVTDLREAEQKIQTLSFYDGLTNLPNRDFFKRVLKKTIANAEREQHHFALLKINLNDFMRININLGHQAGDNLLLSVSQRLKEAVRDSDEFFSHQEQINHDLGMLAHFGGDKFIILLKGIKSSDDAAIVAQRLKDFFKKPFDILDNQFHINVSIGIGIYPDDGYDPDELLKNTTIALQNAKESGKGKSCYRYYTEAMNVSSFQRLSLEVNLRKAIEYQQFVLYYQPKISLLDGSITGAEALIRWDSPEMGMVSPMSFIPVAETTGLIVPITDWVIMEACRQLGEWRRNGLALESVAINITPASLLDKNINDHVFKNLQLAGVDASRLDFEITESVLMEDVDVILPILKELKDFGASISIDDFGTGYSSLSYLKRLPISKLKIDQSFIRDLMNDTDDSIIVNAVISLAHSLGLKVIAEGVEELEQLQYLRDQACDVVQGYYYSRPLPAADFYQWAIDYEKSVASTKTITMVG